MFKYLKSLVNKSLLDKRVKESILNGRGNLESPFPSDFSAEEKEIISSVRNLTMTSLERLVSLCRSIDYVTKNEIEGDIVECGVWRGGSMMAVAKKLLKAGDSSRTLYLFDTFEGMSAPEEKDVSAVDKTAASKLLDASDRFAGANVWCYSSLEEVKSNLGKTNYNPERVIFVKGKVEDTLPYEGLNKIALLRLDTDWYESTKHELETLYDKLVPGGVLIIDDYGHWEGCKLAVDEFIERRNLSLHLIRVDYTGRIAIKN